jgi:acetyl-CoA synthase
MPKALKEFVAAKLNATAKDLYGIDDYVDRIADETVTEDAEKLVEFLSEHEHPVLQLEPLM